MHLNPETHEPTRHTAHVESAYARIRLTDRCKTQYSYIVARSRQVVRLSSKGQVIIPATLRRALRLETGQRLSVQAGAGRAVVFVPLEGGLVDADDMLRRARGWAARSGRDLVDELHRRRQTERAREVRAGERGRH